jgi:hypothetical protein
VALGGYGAGRLLPRAVVVGCLIALLALAAWWHVSGRIRFPGDRAGIQANKELAQAGPAGILYFGLLLGVGFRTRMATPLWYAIPLSAAAVGGMGAAGGIGAVLALGAGAGLGRSWPVARAVADARGGRGRANGEGNGQGNRTVVAALRIATRQRSDVARAVAAVVIMAAALVAWRR